eukprot:s2238_g5.t1
MEVPADVVEVQQPEAAAPSAAVEASDIVEDATQDQQQIVENEPEKATCAKCRVAHPCADMIKRPSARVDLRHVCKSCNALNVQLSRKGLVLQNLLSEAHVVNFYANAAAERADCEDGRLSFGRSRGILKRLMVEEARRERRDGHHGTFEPLSVYELRGYDTDLIKNGCEKETHPVLGDTYRLDLHSVSDDFFWASVERRLCQLEHEAKQKKLLVEQAAGMQQLDIEHAIEIAEPKSKAAKRKGPMSEEEKEAAKKMKLAAKKQAQERKNAAAAAVKLIPSLKAVQSKLASKIQDLQATGASLPEASEEQTQKAVKNIDAAVVFGGLLLDRCAKGKSLDDLTLEFSCDKDLNSLIKEGNAAVRVVADFLRSQKENVAPKAKGRGKAKAKILKS